MKKVVSISIGSSTRDKEVEIELLGEKIHLERIGTDGDLEEAARLYGELDGKVDAFGVGGAILGTMLDDRWTEMHSVKKLTEHVKLTPVVDGTGLKMTLEKQVAEVIEQEIGGYLQSKRAFVAVALDRWGTARSFLDAGYECVFGDLMFSLGIPFAIHSEKMMKNVASLILPIATRLPFEWLYPIGEKQEQRSPKWEEFFKWADVVAGDCHYVWKYMPEDMKGKVIVTNTTTVADREFFRQSGVKYLITTTPMLDGRSFGTNMMEAALVAAVGRKEPIDYGNAGQYLKEIEKLIAEVNLRPQLQDLQAPELVRAH